MCCFSGNNDNDEDPDNVKGWELYVYGSDGDSNSTSDRSSGNTAHTSISSGNSSIRQFQNSGSRSPSPIPSLSLSPVPSFRTFGGARSPSIRSLNPDDSISRYSGSPLSCGRISPINANDVRIETQSAFMRRFNKNLDETFSLKTRY